MSAFPIIISAPSGAGKTTITQSLLALRTDVGYSVSATTRAPRAGEVDGVAYHFLSLAEFESGIASGKFAEYARVHGSMYGTLRKTVDDIIASGRHVVMDIDVQGAAQFAAAYPNAVKIFVLPPDGATLVARLRGRGTETAEAIETRFRDAVTELGVIDDFQYVIVNDHVDRAVRDVSCIIDAESMREERVARSGALTAEIVSALERELIHA